MDDRRDLSMIVNESMVTGCWGRSCGPVAAVAMASTTSCPR
ncbi:MAG: hypothetical protein ACRDXF_05120 [Acidimicrobiia bacterium]